MTSMNTTGYAQVDFAPNQAFTGISRVCWDVNQTDLGGRKWIQVVIVPEATFQANGGRLDYVTPLLQDDVAVGGIRITGETFLLEMFRGSTQTFVGQGTYDADFAGFTTSDKARRFRTCMTDLENGNIRFELERGSGTDVRDMQGSFPNGPARVIFQDDSYNSPKDVPATPNPFTWHWDNISIST